MRHLKLVCNMRAQSDPWFADYLLRIGGGTEEVNGDGNVRIPDEICVPYSRDAEKDLHTLIDIIFSNLNANMADKDYITTRAILSTRNDWVDMINMKMIDMFQGGETVYHSSDSAVRKDVNQICWEDFKTAFRSYHVPEALVEIKEEEFLNLKQGSMTLMTVEFPDFQTLVNRTILIKNKRREIEEKKRRIQSQSQVQPYVNQSPPQEPLINSPMKDSVPNTSSSGKKCYRCGEPGHYAGMSLDCDIEFIIELLPRTAPIAKRPY
ncbi:uncharacterized protein [Miscanthus floridulus]|uniref:uncharacterized protein n=1 Tax=Miscanthus floridulus TaxID=154761 RepID=UPI003458B799